MLAGMYYLNRRYTFTKYLSVLMVTAGIIICTIESRKVIDCCDGQAGKQDEPVQQQSHHWLLGVAMMTCSLFLGARMGIFQEQIYQSYGKFPKEALFYTVIKKGPSPHSTLVTLQCFCHSICSHCLAFYYSVKTFTTISWWLSILINSRLG